MPDIVDRLERKMRAHVHRSFPAATGRPDDEPIRNLLLEYQTWRSRFVSPVPRTVEISRELAESDDHAAEIQILRDKIVAGTDITPHLSERITDPFQNTRAPDMEHRTHRDTLLSVWGLHHLHLTNRPNAATIPRRGDVLIAAFTDQTAYFVDIVPHATPDRGWAEQRIFEALVRNWPDSGLVLRSNAANGLSRTITDPERRRLHNGGASTLMEVDGAVYLPRTLGQMGDGSSLQTANNLMMLLDALRRCREDFEGTLRAITTIPAGAYWVPDIHCPRPGFVEQCGFSTSSPQTGPLFVPVGRIC